MRWRARAAPLTKAKETVSSVSLPVESVELVLFQGKQNASTKALVQFQSAACFRSKGPAVSSPVREGGEPHPLDNSEAPEDRGAGTNPGAPSALR